MYIRCMKHYYFLALIFLFGCGGGGGGGSAPVAPAPAQVTVSLTGSASTLDQGQTFTLTWSSTSATSCTASGTWSGTKATSGSEAFSTSDSPIGDYSFGLQCSGSGGSSASSSVSLKLIEPLYNLSGKVQVAYNSFTDSDVPNSEYTSTSNGATDVAQDLSLPSQLVGYVSQDTDEWDVYKVNASKNQGVAIEIVDFHRDDPSKNNLNLVVTDLDNKIVQYSVSVNSYEYLVMPEGEYFIAIHAFSGASKYVLSIGTRFSKSYSTSVFSSKYDYQDDKLLIQKNELLSLAQEASREQSELLDQLGFDYKNDNSSYIHSEKSEYLDPRKVFKKFGLFNDSSQMSRSLRAQNPEVVSQAEKRHFLALLNAKTPQYTILPNVSVSGSAFSTDQEYYKQWHHVATNLDDALNSIGQTTKDIVVAVVDSGRPSKNSAAYNDISFTNDEMDFLTGFAGLGKSYLGGNDADGSDGGIDNDATDDLIVSETRYTSHGTHVASTIAAKNNGSYINGMAVKVMPVRVIPNGPFSGSLNDILQGLKYAAGLSNDSLLLPSKRADIINASLGIKGGGGSEYCEYIKPIVDTGVIFVAASGNDASGGFSVSSWPANCPGVISVGAHDIGFNRAPYSNFNSSVDISAPGGDNNSGDRNGDGEKDGVYAWINAIQRAPLDGTSMAAPQVAGAIGLMMSIKPNLTYDDVSSMLASGLMTRDLGPTGRDDSFGHGALDIAKAISSLDTFDSSASKTFGSLTQSTYDFGTDKESINMTLVKYGSSDIKVTRLACDNCDGLSYGTTSNEEGFGEYTIALDRAVYENGTYHNAIYFVYDNGTYSRAYITYNVGPEPPIGSIEVAYIGLRDSSGEFITYQKLDLTLGTADFSFIDLKEGPYDIVIATDIDGDDSWCTSGEFCRFFPFDTSFGAFTLTADTDIGTLGLAIGSALRASSMTQRQSND